MLEKVCESCDMPMTRDDDFGGSNPSNKYCNYCTDEHGNLKNYEDVLEGMTDFVVSQMGLSDDEARQTAADNMAQMPAWKNRE